MLGVGGVAVGGGLAGSAIEVKASAASTQAAEEDGTYAAGPLGLQRVLWSADTDQQVAAITFDDGPTPGVHTDGARRPGRRPACRPRSS